MIKKYKHTRTDPRDVNKFIFWLSVIFAVACIIACNADKIKEFIQQM